MATTAGKARRSLQDWEEFGGRRLKRIVAQARRICAKDAKVGSVELSCIGLARMRTLNRKYRGKDFATDVLSFEAPDPVRLQGWWGELIVCIPVLLRQARERGHSPEIELDILLVHGVLHLLGFDHERGKTAAAKMARYEKQLLEAIGRPASLAGLIERTK